MAASANPSENNNNQEGSSPAEKNGTTVNSVENGSTDAAATVAAEDNSQTVSSMVHGRKISTDWSPEEQSLLEELLIKYEGVSRLARYAKIAMEMNGKGIRDVAMRCRWMSKKENGKRRKEDLSRKNKDKKEKTTDSSTKSSSQMTVHPNAPPPFVPLVLPSDTDDGIPAIGGASGDLLEQNDQMLSRVVTNLTAFQIHENLDMLSQARANIIALMNDMDGMPEFMKQMPPLTVKMNEELVNKILPQPPRQKKKKK